MNACPYIVSSVCVHECGSGSQPESLALYGAYRYMLGIAHFNRLHSPVSMLTAEQCQHAEARQRAATSARKGRRRRQRRSTTPRAVERYSRESTNRALRRLRRGGTTN